jgi:hypothetical protein
MAVVSWVLLFSFSSQWEDSVEGIPVSVSFDIPTMSHRGTVFQGTGSWSGCGTLGSVLMKFCCTYDFGTSLLSEAQVDKALPQI